MQAKSPFPSGSENIYHERRMHGHHHAGIRIVREGTTLIPTLDAHSRHPGVFTEGELVGFATATAPAQASSHLSNGTAS